MAGICNKLNDYCSIYDANYRHRMANRHPEQQRIHEVKHTSAYDDRFLPTYYIAFVNPTTAPHPVALLLPPPLWLVRLQLLLRELVPVFRCVIDQRDVKENRSADSGMWMAEAETLFKFEHPAWPVFVIS